MKIITLLLQKLFYYGSTATISYFFIRNFSYKFMLRKKIMKDDISYYLPHVFNKNSSPNNLTPLKLTFIKGKLEFSLINKETNYIDTSIENSIIKEINRQQKELEANSFNFKILVFWERKSKLIKFINLKKNIISLNKTLMNDYNIELAEKDITHLINYITRVNNDFLLYNNTFPYYTINFYLYSNNKETNSLFFPVSNKYINVNIGLIDKHIKTKMKIDGFNNIITISPINPLIIFYLIKSEGKMILFINTEEQSQNIIFETDLIKLLRMNPYFDLYYKKVDALTIQTWIENESLIEIFCLNDQSSLHSIQQIQVSDEKTINLSNFVIKSQLLELVKLIFEEKVIVDDVDIDIFKYN